MGIGGDSKKICILFSDKEITRQSNQFKFFVSGLSCGVNGAGRGDEQTLRGGTEADVTRYQTVDNVRTQEIVSTKVRLQWNLKEPALMVHLGAEMLAMQLVIRQLPPGLRPGFLMRGSAEHTSACGACLSAGVSPDCRPHTRAPLCDVVMLSCAMFATILFCILQSLAARDGDGLVGHVENWYTNQGA